MILDAENLLCEDLDFAGADELAAVVSTNVIDLAGAAQDMGPGNVLRLLIQVTEAFAGDVAAVTATVQTDTVAAFSSPTTVIVANALAGTLGETAELAINKGLQRFLRISFALDDAATAGMITAGIVDTFQRGFGQ